MRLAVYDDRYKFSGDENEALYFVGAFADFEEKSQPQFMREMGLKPGDKFLDLACGCLRGTWPLVDYLNDGDFYGADVSQGLLDAAAKRLSDKSIKNTPTLRKMNDFNLEKLFGGVKFDHILSVSFLTHVLPHDIPSLFRGVSEILKPGAAWYFTMYPTASMPGFGNVELHFYNKTWLMDIGDECGLKVEDLPGVRPNPCPNPNNINKEVNSCLGQWVMKAVKC